MGRRLADRHRRPGGSDPNGGCDAFSLGLPEIGRLLVCAGPDSQVRAVGAAGQDITYRPGERAAVLAEVDVFVSSLVAEQELWPGEGLLPPLFRQA